MGGQVRHAAIVRDVIEEIATELRNSINRRPDLILTCGGLGPTADDVTLQAVARATHRELVTDERALRMVEEKYLSFAARGFVSVGGVTESRRKMACVPEGARAIENPLGAAPVILLEAAGARIVSLPGVPAELVAIVEGPLQEFLAGVFGKGSYREQGSLVECGDESELAPLLEKVSAANPRVYVKSRAAGFKQDNSFRLLLSTAAADPKTADDLIAKAWTSLDVTLSEAGIKLHSISE